MEYGRTIFGAALSGESSSSATSDDVLIALIANGDRDAVRLLFARHNVRIFRFILRIVGNEATAEDLLNDVFLEVWRSANRFEARSQVTTWLLGIARFKALSALRRQRRDLLDDELDESIQDPGDDPEATVQTIERREILQSCLKQLSRAHREIIDLVYYHEQSIDEVAEIIGVPPNTVKTRLFHARKRMAKLLDARGLERACL
jgi:RNA polymerase sigma-70 factor (ECF subfamily)